MRPLEPRSLGNDLENPDILLVEPMLKMNRFSHFFQHIMIDIQKHVLESFYIHKNVLESFFSETIAFNA